MDPKEKPSKETLNEWHKDPSNWILGMFYFNKKDKRLFPPKRLAYLGWTINFANPLSVLAILAIIILTTLLINIIERK